jgi:2-polyprenyl-3-methyl-5-hydroxy-6-metoxy-1,4-benzoquinol methylase
MDQPIIRVDDEGNARRVHVLVPQHGHFRFTDFESPWPADLLESLARLKGSWFCDSYARFEHPNYLQKQIDQILELYGIALPGLRILDFGCGFGASSYGLVKRGATDIVATDLVDGNIAFARALFTRLGLDGRIDLRREDIVPALEPDSFDVVWLQAVVEHLLPDERQSYLRQFWRALRPGGWLVVTETPNRVWPYETHTSGGRWFLPWMPAERIFATMRREAPFAAHSDVDFYRSGIVGSTYRQLLDCLGRPPDCEEPARELSRYFARLYADARVKTTMRRTVVSVLGLLEPGVRRILRRPVMAFTPYLNHLAFRKAR